jgi:hypothetical protein
MLKNTCYTTLWLGWSMKFRETKFREIIPFVFREIYMFILQSFVKFLPRNFVSCLTKQKIMLQRQRRKEQQHFRHPFLHNEMVAPQASIGKHSIHRQPSSILPYVLCTILLFVHYYSICILTLLSSGNVKFKCFKGQSHEKVCEITT